MDDETEIILPSVTVKGGLPQIKLSRSKKYVRMLKKQKAIPVKKTPEAVAIAKKILEHELVEVCIALYLDNQNNLICWHEVSRGTVNTAIAHQRETFAAAIAVRAVSIIFAHNHLTNNTNPSTDDNKLTEVLVKAGETIGIPVVDRIIVSHSGSYSFFRKP